MRGNPDVNTLKLLWVDDDHELTSTLADFLSGDGFRVDCAPDIESATKKLADDVYDLVLVDLDLPDGSGFSLIRDTPRTRAHEFVVVTGHGSVKTAVEALHHQVFDYLLKPIELSELRNVLGRVRNARNSGAAPSRSPASKTRTPARNNAELLLLGESPAMRQAQALVNRAAASEITVLVQGESGTGKEVVARALHRLSLRANGPFVALNCGAVSPTLIASELFGHERGSFTGAHQQHKGIFERADGGTLFLDEVTEMPIDLQANLLRVLETGTVVRVGGVTEIPVNVRVVAATNQNPMQYVEQGKLRLDLYYRLQVFPIVLPPLRERGDDILLLIDHFLTQSGENARNFAPAARERLLSHTWPGNVRELRNVIERARLLSTDVIELEHLMLPADTKPAHAHTAVGITQSPTTGNGSEPPGGTLHDVEQEMILQTLQACGGNRSRTAATLGISVKTLYNKLKRIERREAPPTSAPHKKARRIALLINDADVSEALAALLTLHEFGIVQARDMRGFGDATKNLDIDIVIFDLHLASGVSGIKLVEEYQAKRKKAGVPPATLVALTGSADGVAQLAATELSLTKDRVIVKPVDYPTLLAALE